MTTPKSPTPATAGKQDVAKAEVLSDADLDRVQGGLKPADLSKSDVESPLRTTNVAGTASGGGSR